MIEQVRNFGRLYVEGFRDLGPLGRRLWVVILVKLAIMFGVLKVFFFPKVLEELPTETARSGHVAGELIERAVLPATTE